MPTKIILAGEGGQGGQSLAKIIARAAQNSGKISSYLPNFGVEQRGGVSLAYLQISSNPIPYPRFAKARLVIAFCNRAVQAVKDFMAEDTLFIFDNSAVDQKHLEKVKDHVRDYLMIPAQKLAREKLTSKVANVVLLGAVAAHLKEINFSDFENAVLEEFADKIAKKPEIKELNLGALKAGLEEAQKFDKEKQPMEGAPPAQIKTNFTKVNISWSRFPEYCKGCGLCLIECPVDALKFSNESGFLGNPLPEVDMEKCIGCLKCMKICPDGAIGVEKTDQAE